MNRQPAGMTKPLAPAEPDEEQGSLLEFLMPAAQNWGRLVILPLMVGTAAVGVSFMVAPTFEATTTLLPPQQQQSIASNAIASLGALAGISGALPKSPADQYVSLMLSVNATDRVIDKFKLLEIYNVPQRWQARRELLESTIIAVGKKDGLITISVEDTSPQRAAEIANQYVGELRRLTSELAISEAQSRRIFFEGQLETAKQRLTTAQTALQGSGFTVGALKTEPKAAAETYAKLRAELTGAEVRLQAARGAFTDTSAEVRLLLDTVAALRSQLARSEAPREPDGPSADYVGKYREFKYQEALFELLSRQYELAKVDESREGAVIQVVDVARAPERKLRPKRAVWGGIAAAIAFLVGVTFVIGRRRYREAESKNPAAIARWRAFVDALRPWGSRLS